MKLMTLSQKLVGAALKASPLAVVVAGLFAMSPVASAQSCVFDWPPYPIYVSPGTFYNSGQLFVGNMGTSGANVNVEYQQSGGNFNITNLGVTSNLNVWPTSGPAFLTSYQVVSFGGQVPPGTVTGQWAQVTMTVSGTVGGELTQCSQSVTVTVQNPCSQKVTESNGTVLTATLDSGTGYCKIEPVPAGATGAFVYNNAYYVDAYKTTTCLPGAGSWDGANCWYMTQPAGGTLYQNSFFVPSSKGNSCSLGTYDSSTNSCLVKSAPWGTEAFLYTIGGQVQWYFTPQMTCPIAGEWDSAHCYIMAAPTGKTAILFNNTFYYH